VGNGPTRAKVGKKNTIKGGLRIAKRGEQCDGKKRGEKKNQKK